jgi:hypothetical protein
MPNQALTDLTNEITNATSVEASATALINGIAAQIQAAVQAAIANGATAAELQPVADLGTQLQQQSDALQAAITANTPASP